MSYSLLLKSLFAFTFLTFLVAVSDGRKCFSCTTMNNERCLHLTRNETKGISRRMVVNCKHYCTVRRQEYVDDRGGVAWLNRSCEDEYLDSVMVNGYFKYYYRSCKQNLCNDGDGIESFGDIIIDYDDYEEEDYTEYANFTMNSGSKEVLFLQANLIFIACAYLLICLKHT